MNDREFLMWLHERLEHQHSEDPLYDYMHKLRAIIANTPPNRCSRNTAAWNTLDDLRQGLVADSAEGKEAQELPNAPQ